MDTLRLRPGLRVDALFRAAARSLGVPELDDEMAREPLEAILDSIEQDLRFNSQGRVLIAQRLVHSLRMRHLLRSREATGRLPRVDSSNGPLLVTGFPRTGTTLSHKLLSLADDARSPSWCELMEPVLDPRLDREVARRRRLRKYRVGIFLAEGLMPGIRRVHELVADGPEECTTLHEHAFDSESLVLMGECRGYRDWLDERTPSRRLERYRLHARLLASILADRPPETDPARWVLKAPQHMLQLDELFEVHPDARVIRLHRDPVAAIASTGSLLQHTTRLFTSRPDIDFGEDLLETFTDWQRRGDEGMARHPGRVLDVAYEQLVADPTGFIERVHDFAGLPIDPVHVQRVRAYLQTRPKHRWGRHEYSIDRYGITPERIREELGEYIERVEVM